MAVDLQSQAHRELTARVLDIGMKGGVAFALAYGAFAILRPFVGVLTWGAVIAVALFPVFRWIKARLGGRAGLAATALVAGGALGLGLPCAAFLARLSDGVMKFVHSGGASRLRLPSPPPALADVAVVGPRLTEAWETAGRNLSSSSARLSPRVEEALRWLVDHVLAAGRGALLFIGALIIAGVLLAHAEACERGARRLGLRLVGQRGPELVTLCVRTVRSVAVGVVGVALIEAVLAGVGMSLAGVPLAGVWSLLVFLTVLVQVPGVVVLGPVAVYVAMTADHTTAVVFGAWALLVGLSDNFLKPLLLGRGVEIPMLVVLVGSIGGMVVAGVVGLFVGAVVLALAYQLSKVWVALGLPHEAATDTGAASEVSSAARTVPPGGPAGSERSDTLHH